MPTPTGIGAFAQLPIAALLPAVVPTAVKIHPVRVGGG